MATVKEPMSPYLAGRLEFTDRYGPLVIQARNWRATAWIAMILLGASLGGNYYLTAVSGIKYIPVVVDKRGETQAGTFAPPNPSLIAAMKEAALWDRIGDMRSVTTDGVEQVRKMQRALAFVAENSAAKKYLSDSFKQTNPGEMMRSETRDVAVHSVLPLTANTYQVNWTENTRDLMGNVTKTEEMSGSFTTKTASTGTRANPLGLFIHEMSWSVVQK